MRAFETFLDAEVRKLLLRAIPDASPVDEFGLFDPHPIETYVDKHGMNALVQEIEVDLGDARNAVRKELDGQDPWSVAETIARKLHAPLSPTNKAPLLVTDAILAACGLTDLVGNRGAGWVERPAR